MLISEAENSFARMIEALSRGMFAGHGGGGEMSRLSGFVRLLEETKNVDEKVN